MIIFDNCSFVLSSSSVFKNVNYFLLWFKIVDNHNRSQDVKSYMLIKFASRGFDLYNEFSKYVTLIIWYLKTMLSIVLSNDWHYQRKNNQWLSSNCLKILIVEVQVKPRLYFFTFLISFISRLKLASREFEFSCSSLFFQMILFFNIHLHTTLLTCMIVDVFHLLSDLLQAMS